MEWTCVHYVLHPPPLTYRRVRHASPALTGQPGAEEGCVLTKAMVAPRHPHPLPFSRRWPLFVLRYLAA